MLLQCEQCGLLSNVMIKLPSTLTTAEAGKIVFELNSTDSYVNLCLQCIGYEKENLTT